MDSEVAVPTVHLNGTSSRSLMDQYKAAAMAVQLAAESLPAPHGRDYYPQGDEAYMRALNEHRVRQQKLKEVYDELFAVYNGVAKQRGTL
jgi:hypothetical protein